MRLGEEYTFSIREGANGKDGCISVNYDGFIDDVSVGGRAAGELLALTLHLFVRFERCVRC